VIKLVKMASNISFINTVINKVRKKESIFVQQSNPIFIAKLCVVKLSSDILFLKSALRRSAVISCSLNLHYEALSYILFLKSAP